MQTVSDTLQELADIAGLSVQEFLRQQEMKKAAFERTVPYSERGVISATVCHSKQDEVFDWGAITRKYAPNAKIFEEKPENPEQELAEKLRENDVAICGAIRELLPKLEFSNAEVLQKAYSQERFMNLRFSGKRVNEFSHRNYQRYKKFSPLSDEETEKLLLQSKFGKRYLQADWEKAKSFNAYREAIATDFILNGTRTTGYYIYGNVGIGKSSVMCLTARMLAKYLDISVFSADSQRLMDAFASIDDADKQYVRKCAYTNILFIDAFGWETVGTDGQIAKMTHLLRQRYDNCLTTFICSNIDLRTMANRSSLYKQFASYLDDSTFITPVEFKGVYRRN